MRASILVLLVVLLAPVVASADLAPIQIDGYFDDWNAVTAVHDDSNDDAGPVDFGRIWVANDQDYLFFRFETGGEVQPDEQQNMRLYIDTDMNSSTGTYFNGIGAELMWEFGWREGTFKDGGTYTVDHYDVGLQMGPTVSNTEFEVAFKRNAVPAGGQSLFNGRNIRFILRDTDSADVAPSSGSITPSIFHIKLTSVVSCTIPIRLSAYSFTRSLKKAEWETGIYRWLATMQKCK